MTTLAVARNRRSPAKKDNAERTSDSEHADKGTSLPALLANSLPTGLVTAYTAFIAVVTETVSKPTKRHPDPNLYLTLRWIGFAALVILAAAVTYGSYQRKADDGARLPLPEIAAVTVAAAAWGLGLPESPLLAGIHDKGEGVITVALIAFIGVGVNLALGRRLQRKAGT